MQFYSDGWGAYERHIAPVYGPRQDPYLRLMTEDLLGQSVLRLLP